MKKEDFEYKEDWSDELDEYVQSNDHNYQCIGFSEGCNCCLQINEDDVYGTEARIKLNEIVNKAIKSTEDQARKEALEEVREMIEKQKIEGSEHFINYSVGYNQALDDLLTKLEEL